MSMITMDTLCKLAKGKETRAKYIVGRIKSALIMRIKTRCGWWIADTTDVYIQVSNFALQLIIIMELL